MRIEELMDLYNLISRGRKNFPTRRLSMDSRKLAFQSSIQDHGFTKVAFDTRRIDQETEFNPRRGLQNYNRSQAFVNDNMSQKIRNFSRLRTTLNSLKEVYGKTPEWQDSNARVLLTTLDNGLRTFIKDGDYTDVQPGMGSFNYIEELLHVRYRLTFDDLVKMGEADLKQVILGKDEELTRQDGGQQGLEITKSDVANKNYDTLLEKLFNVQASTAHPDVERTVTITVRDTIRK